MPERKGELAARVTHQLLPWVRRARRRRCQICLCGLAATSDVRISATAPSTQETWPRSMTARGAMIHSASTIPPDGGRCVRSCCGVICCAGRVAMKPAQKPTTSYRRAKAAQCGHSITCKGCAPGATRRKRGARTAHKGMPVILPTLAAAAIRSRTTRKKPQVLGRGYPHPVKVATWRGSSL